MSTRNLHTPLGLESTSQPDATSEAKERPRLPNHLPTTKDLKETAVKQEAEGGDSTDTMDLSDQEVGGDLQGSTSQVLNDATCQEKSLENVIEDDSEVKVKSTIAEPTPEEVKEIKTEEPDIPIDVKQEVSDEPCTSSTRHAEPPVRNPQAVTPKKVVRSGSRLRHTRSSRFPTRPGIVWREGAKLEAQDFQNKWYTAKVLEIDASDDTVLIHFDGWNSRFDEWLSMSSDRLRCIARHSERKERRSNSSSRAEHKVGQCVFAKWTDCRMYPGKIERINTNGNYEVLFYDGFKKTVLPMNIKTMLPDVKQQYAKAGLLPEPGKKNKFPIREIAKEIQERKLKDKKEGDNAEDEPETSEETEREGKRLGERRRKSIEAAIALKKSKLEGDTMEKKERRNSREGRLKDSKDKKEAVKQKAAKEIKSSPQTAGRKEADRASRHSSSRASLSSAHDTPVTEPRHSSTRASLSSAHDTLVTDLPADVHKCPFSVCTKSFRKQSMVDYHVKYFHTQDGALVQPSAPRKRTKTTSVCSEDSEHSLCTSAGLKSSGKKQRKRDRTSQELYQQPADDDLNSNADTKTTTTEEYQTELYSHAEDGGHDDTVERIEKDEVVNCICQINEENGLMIQCDVCLCWQHAPCMELTEETLPAKYMCVVCTNPPGVRDSARFSYDQDWLKHGMMASFSFLAPDSASVRKCETMRATHGLVSDVLNVKHVLKSSELQLDALQKKNTTELNVWRRISAEASTSQPPHTISSEQIRTEDPLSDVIDRQNRTSADDPDSPHSAHSDSTVSAEESPMSSDDHLLHYVDTIHDNIEARLDLIEQQITHLEAAEERHANKAPAGDVTHPNKAPTADIIHPNKAPTDDVILKDLPKVKRSLHYIVSDLGKVKRLSLHNS